MGLGLKLAPRPSAEGPAHSEVSLRLTLPAGSSGGAQVEVQRLVRKTLLQRGCTDGSAAAAPRRSPCWVQPGGQAQGHQYLGRFHPQDDLARDHTSSHRQRSAQTQFLRVKHEQVPGRAQFGEVHGAGAVFCGTVLLGGRVSGGPEPGAPPLAIPARGDRSRSTRVFAAFKSALTRVSSSTFQTRRELAPPYYKRTGRF